MWIVALLPMVAALASAAEYSVVDPPPPPSYVPEKPPLSPPLIALLAKLVETLQYDSYAPEPVVVEEAEPAYSDNDLGKLLSLVLPKQYGPKTTVKILDHLPGVYGGLPGAYGPAPGAYGRLPGVYGALPGVYGGLPPYALNPALLGAAYKPAASARPGYAAPPNVNLVYPSGLPAYNLPAHPAPKLPLGHAGVYGYPAYAPSAYGLPPLPLVIITKGEPDDYVEEAATEAPAPVAYEAKPKKPAVKLVAVAKKTPSYAPAKVIKVVTKPAKAYATKAAKAKAYPAVVKAAAPDVVIKASYPSKTVKVAAATLPAAYADEVVAPVVAAPAYAPVATEAPAVDLYPAEVARSALGGEAKNSSAVADVAPAKHADSAAESSSGAGESARASPTDHGISSQSTIS